MTNTTKHTISIIEKALKCPTEATLRNYLEQTLKEEVYADAPVVSPSESARKKRISAALNRVLKSSKSNKVSPPFRQAHTFGGVQYITDTYTMFEVPASIPVKSPETEELPANYKPPTQDTFLKVLEATHKTGTSCFLNVFNRSRIEYLCKVHKDKKTLVHVIEDYYYSLSIMKNVADVMSDERGDVAMWIHQDRNGMASCVGDDMRAIWMPVKRRNAVVPCVELYESEESK